MEVIMRDLMKHELDKVVELFKQLSDGEITEDEYIKAIKKMNKKDECPKCGYPKFKQHHEDFERHMELMLKLLLLQNWKKIKRVRNGRKAI